MTLGAQFYKRESGQPVGSSSRSWTRGNTTVYGYGGGIRDVIYEYRPEPDMAGAAMSVIHHGGSSTTTIPNDYDAAWASASEVGETIPLFEHSETAPYSMVNTLNSTEAARVPAMKMLAIADADTRKEYGRGLTPSGNLSPHSRRMLEHLEDVGATVVPPHTSNSQTFWNENQFTYGGQPLPKETVKAGGRRLREVLGSSRKSDQPQYEQPELPGM